MRTIILSYCVSAIIATASDVSGGCNEGEGSDGGCSGGGGSDSIGGGSADRLGWQKYFVENPTEFHNLPLVWEPGSQVPGWLTGTYVRNGPAQLSFGSDRRVLTSWLEGFAKLHSFKFNGSQVLFSGKMLESPNYLASLARGELVPQKTLNKFRREEEEWSLWENILIATKVMMLTAYDNNSPAVWRLGPPSVEEGIYIAVTDSTTPIRFNITDLSTIGMEYPVSYPFPLSGCAHFMREVGTQNSINFQGKKHLLGGRPYVEVHRYRPDTSYQNPEVVATFVPKKLSYVHSFSITEHYAVFFFYPVVIDPKKYYSANFHVMELLEVLPGEMTDVYVVHLTTGKVIQLQAPPFYSAHHVNAYEESLEEIVVDLCPTPFNNFRDYLRLDKMLEPPNRRDWVSTTNGSQLTRFRINLSSGDIATNHFANQINLSWINQFDFPVINERYRGQHYCIAYGWTAFDYSRMALVKKNVCEAGRDLVWTRDHHYSSEAWFFPRPGAKKEDDGLLLSVVFDGAREQSYLLLLEASSMEPAAIAYLPHNIPWSAHGLHFPEAWPPRSSSVEAKDEVRDEL